MYNPSERPPLPPVEDYLPITIIVDDYRFDENEIPKFQALAKRLKALGFTVRMAKISKVTAAVSDHSKAVELYVPFKKDEPYHCYTTRQASELAKSYYPGHDALADKMIPVVGMFANLVLGRDLKSPSTMLILWTPDGIEEPKSRTARTGFLGTAIAIAHFYRIPVFNLKRDDAQGRIAELLKQYEALKTVVYTQYQTEAPAYPPRNNDYQRQQPSREPESRQAYLDTLRSVPSVEVETEDYGTSEVFNF